MRQHMTLTTKLLLALVVAACALGCRPREPRKLSPEAARALLAYQLGVDPSQVRILPPQFSGSSQTDSWEIVESAASGRRLATIDTVHDRVLYYSAKGLGGLLPLPGTKTQKGFLTDRQLTTLAEAWAKRLYLFDVPEGHILGTTVETDRSKLYVRMDGHRRQTVPRCLEIALTPDGLLEAINNDGGW